MKEDDRSKTSFDFAEIQDNLISLPYILGYSGNRYEFYSVFYYEFSSILAQVLKPYQLVRPFRLIRAEIVPQ